MRLATHIQLVTEAFERGLLPRDVFFEVTKELLDADDDVAPEDLWLKADRIPGETLDELMQLVAEKRNGRPGGDGVSGGNGQAVGLDPTVLRDEATSVTSFAATDSGPITSPGFLGPVGTARASASMKALSGVDSAAPTEAKSGKIGKTGKTGKTGKSGKTVHEFVPDDSDDDIPTIEETGPEPTIGPVRYQPIDVLGTGGLSEVNECLDTVMGRSVAVKVARADLDERGQALLQREARIIASLEHPNIIPAYDAGFQRGVGPYYVMRKVTQPSLDSVLRKLKKGDVRTHSELGGNRLLRHFTHICNAIEYANQRGIVHCDLKPGNVLLGDFGEVLVVDWGLAYSHSHSQAPRGGTPGYMAPEQLVGADTFDGRTDVFALGALLYHLVALEPAFPQASGTTDSEDIEKTLLELLRAGPIPPSQASPELGIPTELDEICMKALSFERSERHGSARELGQDVLDYLEGRKEAERKAEEAVGHVASGDMFAERYFELADARPDYLARLRERTRVTPPWAPPEDKTEMWDAEEMVKVTDSLRIRTLQAAVAAYEQALELSPGQEQARLGLKRLYHAELKRARRERNELDQIHYEHVLAPLLGDDEDTRRGTLVVEGEHSDVALLIRPLVEDGRRLRAGSPEPVELSGAPVLLKKGGYVLESLSSTHAPARLPVVIEAGSECRIDLDLPLRGAVGDDEVFVSRGPALLGDGGLLHEAREPTEVHVPSFVLARFPVTVRSYLEFIADLRSSNPDAAEAHVPRTLLGRPRWQRDGDRWRAVGFDDAMGSDDLLDLPVFGITIGDAQSYALWLSERTGLSYRLPTDREWEKAARGTDGRVYPWGNQFDATFCKMRDSRPDHPAPEPSGLFEADESPYGVRDMAGGIADWVVPCDDTSTYSSDTHAAAFARGGAWCDWPEDCRVTMRRVYRSNERTARVGFRLARSL